MMQNALPKNSIVKVSRETMKNIFSSNHEKYNASKAEKAARKRLREQGLKV